MGFLTAYKIDGVWRTTPYVKTKSEAEAEIKNPPKLVKATAGRVVRRKDGKIVAIEGYGPY